MLTLTQITNWLRNNCRWDEFRAECKEDLETIYGKDDCYASKYPGYFVCNAFKWRESKSGYDYWRMVAEQLDSYARRFKPDSQCERILLYLQEGNTITSLEALEMFDCLRLGSRIFNLRERGWNISRKSIRTPSGKLIAQYKLEEK